YSYRATANASFELCADFGVKDDNASQALNLWNHENDTRWNHDSGHVCFQRNIDPQLHPPKSSGCGE
ncbi:MAG TPA: hypothetical protein VEF03_08290, partial [Candidatus Binataceae bacterium]|nr:hypothetical protein [Candidatus Binataceae bacterium]